MVRHSFVFFWHSGMTKICVLYVCTYVNDNHASASQWLISHVFGSRGNKPRSVVVGIVFGFMN
jgi:hypothetical protein